MVYFKEDYCFPRLKMGSIVFQGGQRTFCGDGGLDAYFY